MAGLGISEADIYDVFNHGDWITLPSGTTAVIRKYNGYEIGTIYNLNPNGEYAVISPWKKDRR